MNINIYFRKHPPPPHRSTKPPLAHVFHQQATRNYGWDKPFWQTSLTLNPAGTSGDIRYDVSYNQAMQRRYASSDNDAYAWTGHANADRNYAASALALLVHT